MFSASFCNCTIHAYVIFNVAIQGEFIVTVNEPESNTSIWRENDNVQIRIKSTANCIIPSEIKLAWKHVAFNNQTKTLSATSAVLILKNLSKTNSGQYYYAVLKATDNTVIYTSPKTPAFYELCEFQYLFTYCKRSFCTCSIFKNIKNIKISIICITISA